MKRSFKILLALAVLIALLQLGQCHRTNPPVTGDIGAPAEVAAVLRRSCYDCHSNETRWPWYAHVAPMSWLLHRDVDEGRRHLNFSEWDKVPVDKRDKRKNAFGREVKSGDMPPWFYLPLHPAAKLSDADKALVEKWAAGG
ncbi:MAG: heme-binding protein [bacterium]|nr:heme-binding protein [bacterium]